MCVSQVEKGLYEVISVIERMDIDEHGRFYRAMEVRAKTASGIEFTVTVPKAQFKKENVDKLLTAEAKEIEAVRTLKK
jgi:hypothetical protein